MDPHGGQDGAASQLEKVAAAWSEKMDTAAPSDNPETMSTMKLLAIKGQRAKVLPTLNMKGDPMEF